MRSDLGATEEARLKNRGHLEDIGAFEREVRVKLRSKLLNPGQVADLRRMQCPTLSELRALLNDQSPLSRRGGSRPIEADNHQGRDDSSLLFGRTAASESSGVAGVGKLSETCIDQVYTFKVREVDLKTET